MTAKYIRLYHFLTIEDQMDENMKQHQLVLDFDGKAKILLSRTSSEDDFQ